MVTTLSEAQERLEAEGLYVAMRNAHSLWVAAAVRDAGGVLISDEACRLIADGEGWVAVFPSEGQCIYVIPGTLQGLADVVSAVHHRRRSASIRLKDAFRQVVDNPDQYEVGRSVSSD